MRTGTIVRWAIILILAALALMQAGCEEALRFAPSEALKQNAEMTHGIAKNLYDEGAIAESEATAELVAGTEATLTYMGRPKTPVDPSQFSTTNEQAKRDALERPDVGGILDSGLEIGLGIAALLGGAGGVRIAGSLRNMHKKAKGFYEVVESNELLKQSLGPDLRSNLARVSNEIQSDATRKLVAEARQDIKLDPRNGVTQ
jgi:hypothetical protein